MSNYILSDFAAFGVCVTLLAVLTMVRGYSAYIVFALLLHCFLPFLTNHVLFDPSYMPDQFRYLDEVQALRHFNFALVESTPVYSAAWIFFFIPMPYYGSVVATSFAATFLFLVLFDYLYASKYFSPTSLIFYLAYPSLALYSATGLRDMFVVYLTLFGIIYLFRLRWIRMLGALALLFIVKFESAVIVVATMPSLLILRLKRLHRAWRLILVGIASVVVLLTAGDFALPEINLFRQALYAEDGGEGLVGGFASPVELLTEGIKAAAYFLIKPFPWEASGMLQLMQSGENLVVTGLLFFLLARSKASFEKKMFLLYFLIVFCFIFGVVVFNFGTAARYRFPAILATILILESPLELGRSGHKRPSAEGQSQADAVPAPILNQ